MRLSVVMPVFNERATIEAIVARVRSVEVPGVDAKELILVDDGSTDGTRDHLADLEGRHPDVRVLLHRENHGKGAALRTGFREASGDVVLIQDADLEYDPHDYPSLLEPIIAGRADVVYGSRFAGDDAHRWVYRRLVLANRLLTEASNMMNGQQLTDMETCYKVFRREVLRDIVVEEDRFGFEPEITAKLAQRGVAIHEVPISYRGRAYDEGKKIGWRDGVRALYCIAKYSKYRKYRSRRQRPGRRPG